MRTPPIQTHEELETLRFNLLHTPTIFFAQVYDKIFSQPYKCIYLFFAIADTIYIKFSGAAIVGVACDFLDVLHIVKYYYII